MLPVAGAADGDLAAVHVEFADQRGVLKLAADRVVLGAGRAGLVGREGGEPQATEPDEQVADGVFEGDEVFRPAAGLVGEHVEFHVVGVRVGVVVAHLAGARISRWTIPFSSARWSASCRRFDFQTPPSMKSAGMSRWTRWSRVYFGIWSIASATTSAASSFESGSNESWRHRSYTRVPDDEGVDRSSGSLAASRGSRRSGGSPRRTSLGHPRLARHHVEPDLERGVA